MTNDCEVIRDLLPLYADDACSAKSRDMVAGHLAECPACREMLEQLKKTEIESDLRTEKDTVIEYGAKKFKRRSAQAGSVIAGIFMVPILVCLIVNLASGAALDWFFVVLSALAVAASLVIVPLMVPRDKAFWTFCAFTASLMVLLAVTCIYSHGSWFFIAASAALFGLAAVFLPFVIRARPVKKWIGGSKPWLMVLVLDAALFVNMMNAIFFREGFSLRTVLFTVGVVAGAGYVVSEIMRNRKED